MQTRRTFLTNGLYLAAGLSLRPERPFSMDAFRSNRPPLNQRNFHSKAVEATIVQVQESIKDSELAWMFGNCLPNTLDTTVRYREADGVPDTFVITGDIPAMWLRDSTAQVWPYLPLAKEDESLRRLLAGLVCRQTRCIILDPYANAFNDEPSGSPWERDLTDMKPELHERKWEVDSLCYAIRLAHGYWKATGDNSIFHAQWQKALSSILQTFKDQQRWHDKGPYRFERVTSRATDTLPLDGYGNPTKPNGLIHSMFRPSDDACIYPFLIPSNLFAIVSLRQAAEICEDVLKRQELVAECRSLADQVEKAVGEHAIIDHLHFGKIYAYEVDGFGNALFMDDANVPSLLSLPYLGCIGIDEPVYQNTRRFIFSNHNPYFFKGEAASGIGGPHAGLDMIWPLGIIMRALTSKDDSEILGSLRTLKSTHAGTGFMHESFHKDDPGKFSRIWFAWANTLFGELILRVFHDKPDLLERI